MTEPRLQPYPACKPSGVEWLGDVPAHWEVRRLRTVGEAIIGLTYSPQDLVDEGDGTLVLRASNISEGRIVYGDNVFVRCSIPDRLMTQVGDILICSRSGSRALIGKNARIDLASSGETFGAFMTVFRSAHNDYLHSVFNSELFEYQSGVFLTSTINQLTLGILNSFKIPWPPFPEQRAIVRYLDHVDCRIQGYIEAKEKLIGLLQEARQATIHRAVTRGLDPDVPLKPSGVVWLGDVPAHWEVRRLKTLCSMKSGDGISVMSIESAGEYPVYGGNGLRGYTSDYNHDGAFALIGRQGALCGNVHIAQGKFWATEHAVVATDDTGHNVVWFGAILTAMNLNQYSIAAAQPGLAIERILNLHLPVPPVQEQEQIAVHLDKATAGIDAGIDTARRQCELMREYRASLIANVVTGKLDVRAAAERIDTESS